MLSPADLVVFKVLFNRRKDWPDIEQVLYLQGATFEFDYVRTWLVEMVGEDDIRTATWDGLVAEVRGDPGSGGTTDP